MIAVCDKRFDPIGRNDQTVEAVHTPMHRACRALMPFIEALVGQK